MFRHINRDAAQCCGSQKDKESKGIEQLIFLVGIQYPIKGIAVSKNIKGLHDPKQFQHAKNSKCTESWCASKYGDEIDQVEWFDRKDKSFDDVVP